MFYTAGLVVAQYKQADKSTMIIKWKQGDTTFQVWVFIYTF